jgi:lysophospholipase L1-like esterase
LGGADRSGGDDEMAEGSYNRGSLANQANVAAGLLFGVAGRAIQETVLETRAAIQVAQSRGMPVFVMGPPPSIQAGMAGKEVCARLNRAMQKESRERGFPYIDLFPGWEKPFLMWDGLHLTPAGHRHVAERIQEGLGGFVRNL